MVKHGKENKGKNVVLPIFGIIACLFMLFSAVYAHGIVPFLSARENGDFSFPVLFYLIVFAVIMAFGALLYHKNAAVKEIVAWDDQEPAESIDETEK